MNEELYDLWLRRNDAEPPADFADRVMNAVRREGPPSAKSARELPLASPAMRVAACVLAGCACLYRIAAVFAVFFTN